MISWDLSCHPTYGKINIKKVKEIKHKDGDRETERDSYAEIDDIFTVFMPLRKGEGGELERREIETELRSYWRNSYLSYCGKVEREKEPVIDADRDSDRETERRD